MIGDTLDGAVRCRQSLFYFRLHLIPINSTAFGNSRIGFYVLKTRLTRVSALQELQSNMADKQEEDLQLENGEETAGDARDPSGFLSEIIGAEVTVKLNSGIVYKGGTRLLYCSCISIPFSRLMSHLTSPRSSLFSSTLTFIQSHIATWGSHMTPISPHQ
jgi:hypothetical protein